MDRLKKYLEYIKNTGESVDLDQFNDDWDPIGPKVWKEIEDTGLAKVDSESGLLILTTGGRELGGTITSPSGAIRYGGVTV